MIVRTSLASTALLMLAACGGNATQNTAENVAAVLTGDANGSASENPQCKLFSQADAEGYAGATLGPGENSAGGSGCHWSAESGEADVMVQVVPASYAEVPSMAEGYRAMPELGEKGFAAPELGGWGAGVVKGSEFVRVSVSGPKASAETAIALLQETIKRRG